MVKKKNKGTHPGTFQKKGETTLSSGKVLGIRGRWKKYRNLLKFRSGKGMNKNRSRRQPEMPPIVQNTLGQFLDGSQRENLERNKKSR